MHKEQKDYLENNTSHYEKKQSVDNLRDERFQSQKNFLADLHEKEHSVQDDPDHLLKDLQQQEDLTQSSEKIHEAVRTNVYRADIPSLDPQKVDFYVKQGKKQAIEEVKKDLTIIKNILPSWMGSLFDSDTSV
jgi:hypothetical protein